MPTTDRTDWLITEVCRYLSIAVYSMTEVEMPALSLPTSPGVVPEAAFGSTKAFSLCPSATVWIGAAEPAWKLLGESALRAAGVTDPSDNDVRDTFAEIVAQATAALAAALTSLVGGEITVDGSSDDGPPPGTPAFQVELPVGEGVEKPTILIVPSAPLIRELSLRAARPASTNDEPGEATPLASTGAKPAPFDLLLDVELPVCVSFGRSSIPLKDVLKLATGSIVELNRSVTEPVEIIVNNCVIARGEVVVVSGNYGVRIKQIISRNERFRTLH